MPKGSGSNSRATNRSTTGTINTMVAPNEVVLANDLAKMNFKTISIKGKFGKLLGKLYVPFYIMIYGSRFHGKSTVALMFADELVKQHGFKVLYVANEEGAKGTMQEKVVRLGINSPIGIIEDYKPKLFKDYDVVFIDSTQTTEVSHEELIELKKQFPRTSFVIINQANRDGTSKGGTKYEHLVDAIMHIENRCATMEKNRFPNGSTETIKIF